MSRSSTLETGFTLTELMVTMVIVGIVAGISIVSFSYRWNQERLLSTSRVLHSWLDEKRRIAIQKSGTCELSIDTSTATLSTGSEFIFLPSGMTANACKDQAALELRSTLTNGQQLELSVKPSTTQSILFSFRGLSSTQTSDNTPASNTELRIKLPGTSIQRCVKIMNPIGIIRNGVAESSDTECRYSNTF